MPDMLDPSLPLEYFNTQKQRTYYLNPYSGQYILNKSYAKRLQRGYQRGISVSEARGHRVTARGLSESQERRARAEERGGLSPYEIFLGRFERRYGFSYTYWRILYRRYIGEINRRAWSGAPQARQQAADDPRVFPQDLTDVINLYRAGMRPAGYSTEATAFEWFERRMAERLMALVAFQDNNDKIIGMSFAPQMDDTWNRTVTPAELLLGMDVTASVGPRRQLWWYH